MIMAYMYIQIRIASALTLQRHVYDLQKGVRHGGVIIELHVYLHIGRALHDSATEVNDLYFRRVDRLRGGGQRLRNGVCIRIEAEQGCDRLVLHNQLEVAGRRGCQSCYVDELSSRTNTKGSDQIR